MNDENVCRVIREFNKKYQEEVGASGHNVPKLLEKARKKNDIAKIEEYETGLRIADNLMELDRACMTQRSYTKPQCEKFFEGIASWEHEYKFWTNKWYIKPFVSKKKRNESESYIRMLKDTHNRICGE
jgi:hypothetical protein